MSDPTSLYVPPRHITDLAQCHFYHTMDLPGLPTQTGQWDLRGQFTNYVGYVPLAGRRVLDVGCASGFLSFSAEAAGATVVSMDMDTVARQHLLPFADSLYMTDHAAWVAQGQPGYVRWQQAYWLAHRLLSSQALVYYGDVYALPVELGLFDVVLVGSLLEHLGDPIRALASITARCRQTLVINTEVHPSDERVAYFAGSQAHPEANYTFWLYSLGLYRELLGILGFQLTRQHEAVYRCVMDGQDHARCALVATRRP